MDFRIVATKRLNLKMEICTSCAKPGRTITEVY